MNAQKLSLVNVLNDLRQSDAAFHTLFEHGTLTVEIYQPDQVDRQQPHDQDEIYIIASGHGKFQMADKTVDFQEGDFLFVPKKMEHRFFDFSDDFSTWVIFYNP